MKVLLVTFFLISKLLSQSSVKTKNPKKFDKNDDTKFSELDMNTVDAKTVIYAVFRDDELDALENLPVKTQNLIEANINKIIDNVRNGKEDIDLNPIIENVRQERGEEILYQEDWPEMPEETQNLIAEIKAHTAGNQKVQMGLISIMKMMPDGA